MANTQRANKGNPASHRMSNAALKARRAASWLRGRRRKAARIAAQEAAHNRNLARGYSTWDEVKRRRAEQRH